MNDEITRLRAEVAELRKALGERQQLSAPSLLSLRDNYEFVTDMTRYAEGLEGYSEKEVRKKYHFDEATWEALGTDDALVERIEKTRLTRVRDGSFKREKAQQLIVKGPEILDGIMTDPKANAKHKVDAIKTLDSLAANGSQATEQDRVIVNIKIGDDVLRFDAAVKPTPADADTIDATPGLPGFMITARKDGNDDGQPL
jgi:hypothetical protein